METRQITLARCVLNQSDIPAGASTDLLWKCSKNATAKWDNDKNALTVHGHVSFLAYLNLLSMPKLSEYCDIDNVSLSLTVSGDSFILRQTSMNVDTGDERTARLIDFPGIDRFTTVTSQLDVSRGGELVSFEIETEGCVLLQSAEYSTVSNNAKQIDSTRLLIATTTYKKEADITRNAERIKQDLFDEDDSLTGKVKMTIIDNGGTLDKQTIETQGGEITIHESPNVGGAGGFAQGMMLAFDNDFSHVLLMDDDVFVLPEAIRRAYAIAALEKDAYRSNGVLNGAMLKKENPNNQYEDVARVDKDGTYRRIKPDYDMTEISNVISSETTPVDVQNAYGAWWFSMIPVKLIEEHGLPLPVFVRCDDVEFGMRANPRMMSMAGICTWHEKFEGRMNYASDCYQYTRNFLIMNAVDELNVERPFIQRFKRSFKAHLRSLSYDGAEMMVEALEDYLRGPDFLLNANGSHIMQSNAQRNEKMTGNLMTDEETRAIVSEFRADDPAKKPIWAKVLTMIPYNGNRKHLRHHSPAAIYYWMGAYPGSKANAHDTLIAVSDDGTKYSIRQYNRDRYNGIMQRYNDVMRRYRDDGNSVRDDWRKAKGMLVSRKSWDGYIEKAKANEPERFQRDNITSDKVQDSSKIG